MKRSYQEFFDDQAFRYDLARYEELSASLKASPITPGYYLQRGRLILRGEFEDVPRRFLELKDRREGYGDADDRAHAFAHLGIEDGDALVAWMKTAKRPRRAEYVSYRRPKDRSKKRMRKARAALPKGFCHCCRAPKESEKHWLCNERAKERVSRAREAAKALQFDKQSA